MFFSVCQGSRNPHRDYCLSNVNHLIGTEVCDYFGMQTNVATPRQVQQTVGILQWRWSKAQRRQTGEGRAAISTRRSSVLHSVRSHIPPNICEFCYVRDWDLPEPSSCRNLSMSGRVLKLFAHILPVSALDSFLQCNPRGWQAP